MYFFLKNYGYSLNEKFLKKNAAFFRNALVMASIGEYSEYHYLEEILSDAVTNISLPHKKASVKPRKYEEIKDIKMENYKYNYHQQKQG